jgi:peptidoglycan/xylan/chitin deacetylase (PgdA/CDA1 family)
VTPARLARAAVDYASRPRTGVLDRVLLWLAVPLALTQRLRRSGTGVALVYHRLADVAGDHGRELLPAISEADFRAQVAHLQRWYTVVAAGDLPEAARRRRRGEPLPVAITFDDDDPSHVRHAAPILRDMSAPATFFLCGASLDEPRAFWWERLQRVFDAGLEPPAPLSPDDIHATARAIVAMPPAERDRIDRAMLAMLGPDPEDTGLRRDEVAALAADFEVGFHTADHHPLDTLDDGGLTEALLEGREVLESAMGRPCTVIAYPNGRADARTPAAVAQAGFATGFTTDARALRPGTDHRLIGRLDPGSASLGVFATKLAVLPSRRGDHDGT